jgi:hypothetical protein
VPIIRCFGGRGSAGAPASAEAGRAGIATKVERIARPPAAPLKLPIMPMLLVRTPIASRTVIGAPALSSRRAPPASTA